MNQQADIEEHASDLEFRMFESDNNLLPLIPAWEDLAQRCDRGLSFFQKPQWVLAWLAGFGPRKVSIITGWRGGKLSILIALMEQKKIGRKELICATYPEAGYGSALIDDAEDAQAVMLKAFAFLKQNRPADVVIFPSIPKDTNWASNNQLTATPAHGLYAAMVDTDVAAGFRLPGTTSSTSGNKSLKKKYKKLARAGELSIDIIDADHPLADTIIDIMLDWKIDWLDRRALLGQAVRSPNFRTFLKGLMVKPDYNTKGPFCIALCQNEKPIASFLMLPDQEILHCYFTAFNPDQSEMSPGLILISHIVDWMKSSEWQYYDFEGFPEPYKDKMATDRVYLIDVAFPLTSIGKLACLMRQIPIRQTIKKAFYSLPPRLRQAIIGKR